MYFEIESKKFMRFIKPYKKNINAPFFFDNKGRLSYKDDWEHNSDGYIGTLVKSKTKIAYLLAEAFEGAGEEYIAKCISNWKIIKGINRFYDDVEHFYWETTNVDGAWLKDEEWYQGEDYECWFEFKDGKGEFGYERTF